jgi:hypothetical protein
LHQCPLCKLFVQDLERHQIDRHSTPPTGSEVRSGSVPGPSTSSRRGSESSFHCDICYKTYRSQREFTNHRRRKDFCKPPPPPPSPEDQVPTKRRIGIIRRSLWKEDSGYSNNSPRYSFFFLFELKITNVRLFFVLIWIKENENVSKNKANYFYDLSFLKASLKWGCCENWFNVYSANENDLSRTVGIYGWVLLIQCAHAFCKLRLLLMPPTSQILP